MAAALLWALCAAARADYVVQVGVFEKPRHAGEIARALHLAGLKVKAQPIIEVPGSLMIRLMVGPYPTRREAEDALVRLKALGQEGFIRKYVDEPEVKRAQVKPPAEPPPAQAAVPPPAPPVSKEPPIALEQLGAEPPPPPELDEEQLKLALAAPSPGGVPAEDLFGLGGLAVAPPSPLTGFFQSEAAYAWPETAHLSKFRQTLELSAQGRWGRWAKWRVSGRAAYDAVFDFDDYYRAAVKDDQGTQTQLRETYLDINAGNWDFRLGRQHIIWGEMVALFFADVVSAKDLREFVLPDFDMLRIPQWALRSEYFSGDFHGELVWIPYPAYDDIGVPGAEFYPYPSPPPPGFGVAFADEDKPAGDLDESGYGLRLSYIQSGWDVSGFYYSSMDVSPTFFREVVSAPSPAFIYRPSHDRIQQLGATLSKDFESMVLKAELVYTQDRWFEVTRLSDADGVVRQDVFDYAVGLEYPLPARSRLNLQVFQRWFPDHDADMSAKAVESGASIYLSTHWGPVEPQLLAVGSLNRGDWLLRPKLVWPFGRQWRLTGGVDIFGGGRDGLFGRYGDLDRVYTELRYTF